MKVSLNWIKEYVDIEMPPDELSHLLTMTGLEVEGLEVVGQCLDDIIIAKILKVEPHPNADRLSICSVDTGQDKISRSLWSPQCCRGSLSSISPGRGETPGRNPDERKPDQGRGLKRDAPGRG